MQGTALEKYIDALRTKISELERPARQERPARRPRARAAGVGAAEARDEANDAIDEDALVHMMNAVRSPEEARRVLDLMNRGR